MRTRECIKWLWRASAGVRTYVVFNSLVGILHVGASLVFVWVCKSLVDIVVSGSEKGLTPFVCIMTICMLMQILAAAVEQHIARRSDIILKNRLRYRLFTGLMGGRWDGKEAFHTGDSLNRVMEDVRVVAESITNSVPAVIIAAVQFVAAFTFLFFLEPTLAWLIPAIMLLALLASKSYVSRMRRLTKDIRATEGRVQALMQESLQHRLVIHTLERIPFVSEILSARQEELKNQVLDKTEYSVFTRTLIQLGFSTGYAAAFLWGVFGIRSGAVTFGMMTAFLQLVGQLQRPVMNLSRQVSPLINSLTSAERLSEIESQPKAEAGMSCCLGTDVGIRFEDVDYSYPDGRRKITASFSYDFKPGTVTALVGETGVGKSTLIRLILGLISPDKGKVLLYNDVRSISASVRTRCNIVYVPQGNTLMSGTVRDNLLLGDPSADEYLMKEALYYAAADFVYELPAGLDTVCGENGAGLSEGQAQRIVIARSLLRKGSLLLLDEPTSALDAETEEVLLKRLISRMEGRTMIIVTHRETALTLCSDILRL